MLPSNVNACVAFAGLATCLVTMIVPLVGGGTT
jgi:hypothetical protein